MAQVQRIGQLICLTARSRSPPGRSPGRRLVSFVGGAVSPDAAAAAGVTHVPAGPRRLRSFPHLQPLQASGRHRRRRRRRRSRRPVDESLEEGPRTGIVGKTSTSLDKRIFR